jgi:PEP-CTERM motif/Protein of unknown function (DUF642)
MQLRYPHHVKRLSLAVALIGIAAVVLGAPGAARADNLVQNGDFTSYTTGPQGPGALMNPGEGNGGYTVLNGWTIGDLPGLPGYPAYNWLFTPGSADTTGTWSPTYNVGEKLWGPGTGVNNGLTATDPAGGNLVGLDGSDAYRGAISQTITGLIAGRQYQVGFYWAGAQFSNASGPTTESIQVSLGSQTHTTAVVDNASQGFTGWMYETMSFTATAATETLSFLAVGTPTGGPPISLLADVSLNAVPEPSSVVLLGVGLLGAVGYRRLRRRAGAAAA